MKYEWEKQVKKLLQEMQDVLPDQFSLLSVSVSSSVSAEGATIANKTPRHSFDPVSEYDVARDCRYDAENLFAKAKTKYDLAYPVVIIQ